MLVAAIGCSGNAARQPSDRAVGDRQASTSAAVISKSGAEKVIKHGDQVINEAWKGHNKDILARVEGDPKLSTTVASWDMVYGQTGKHSGGGASMQTDTTHLWRPRPERHPGDQWFLRTLRQKEKGSKTWHEGAELYRQEGGRGSWKRVFKSVPE
jgi:hypothetical protein